MKSTKFQTAEPEQSSQETLPERMERLIREEGDLEKRETELRQRLSEAGRQDRAEVLRQGGTLHPLVDAEDLLSKLAQIEVDRSDYRAAIRGLRLEADQALALEARKVRERQRPEFLKAIREYLEAIRELAPVLEAVRQFDEFQLSPLALPCVNELQDLDRRLVILADTLQLRKIDPGLCGIVVRPRPARPVEELSPERKKNLRERFPESTLVSDMPRPGHII